MGIIMEDLKGIRKRINHGGKLAPNGCSMVKCECGYEIGRDITACLNMLRIEGAPLSLKAPNEWRGGG